MAQTTILRKEGTKEETAKVSHFILKSAKSPLQKVYRVKIYANKHWVKFDIPLGKPCNLDPLTSSEKQVVMNHLFEITTRVPDGDFTGEFRESEGRKIPVIRQKFSDEGVPLWKNSPNYTLQPYVPELDKEQFELAI